MNAILSIIKLEPQNQTTRNMKHEGFPCNRKVRMCGTLTVYPVSPTEECFQILSGYTCYNGL